MKRLWRLSREAKRYKTLYVVAFGGWLAFRDGLSVADIVAFVLYLSLFCTPIAGLANLLESMQQSLAGVERVIDILDAPFEIQDRPGAKDAGRASGSLTFEHVDFSYEEGTPVLKDVSFHCEAGKMLALVGPTGVGKITLTQLISRFYEPSSGRILPDGQDIGTHDELVAKGGVYARMNEIQSSALQQAGIA
ncbi:MAG: ABC transporter ATP-binding protein [bacterium]|nr:ABC transporter ATP-binding protein [bacterium]